MEGCLLEEDLAVAQAEAARLTRLLAARERGDAAVCIVASRSPQSLGVDPHSSVFE